MKRVKEAAESLEWGRPGPVVNAEPRSFPGTRPMKQLVKSRELRCSCGIWQDVLSAGLRSSGLCLTIDYSLSQLQRRPGNNVLQFS